MTMHHELADGKWFTLSIFEQLGNVGSEVGRAIKRKSEGDEERMSRALERGLELLDLTIADSRWRNGGRLKELCRAREMVCDYFFGGNEYGSTPESLEKYFMQFAMAARLDR